MKAWSEIARCIYDGPPPCPSCADSVDAFIGAAVEAVRGRMPTPVMAVSPAPQPEAGPPERVTMYWWPNGHYYKGDRLRTFPASITARSPPHEYVRADVAERLTKERDAVRGEVERVRGEWVERERELDRRKKECDEAIRERDEARAALDAIRAAMAKL